jgi:hypothetical protein
VFALVSFVVVDTIPDLVLRPYVSGRSLHVGSVMIAYTFGPLLFGWYGIFLMPMLLVLVFHFARLVLPELVQGREIQPTAIDPSVMTHEPSDEVAEESVEASAAGPDGDGDRGAPRESDDAGTVEGGQRSTQGAPGGESEPSG